MTTNLRIIATEQYKLSFPSRLRKRHALNECSWKIFHGKHMYYRNSNILRFITTIIITFTFNLFPLWLALQSLLLHGILLLKFLIKTFFTWEIKHYTMIFTSKNINLLQFLILNNVTFQSHFVSYLNSFKIIFLKKLHTNL
jgi:hypothetical protein